MKKMLVLFFTLLFAIGCEKDFCPPDEYSRQTFEGFIAYVFNDNSVLNPTPDPINPVKCNCDKNHKVRSGDGLVLIPCPCGANCKCHDEGTGSLPIADDCDKVPTRQVYYFGHDATCGFCKMTKSHVFPELTKMNPPWKIGDSKNDSIRIFEWTQELGDEYNVGTLPTYILFVDKQEIARHTGYIDHIKLSHFYYTGDINKKKPKDME